MAALSVERYLASNNLLVEFHQVHCLLLSEYQNTCCLMHAAEGDTDYRL